jgi:hypothetical protein
VATNLATSSEYEAQANRLRAQIGARVDALQSELTPSNLASEAASRIKCRGSTPPFEIGRGGHVASSNLGNGNLPAETFGKTRQELPLRIAGPLLRPVLGEASY